LLSCLHGRTILIAGSAGKAAGNFDESIDSMDSS
jgi:hypothetical protein